MIINIQTLSLTKYIGYWNLRNPIFQNNKTKNEKLGHWNSQIPMHKNRSTRYARQVCTFLFLYIQIFGWRKGTQTLNMSKHG